MISKIFVKKDYIQEYKKVKKEKKNYKYDTFYKKGNNL